MATRMQSLGNGVVSRMETMWPESLVYEGNWRIKGFNSAKTNVPNIRMFVC